ncbi:MAG TPA: hypothetical protein VMJ34_09855, partial [Bryobacteraceae bacterium]|nr:hypothetical protein [Bryobacteraceae bacterium]
ALHKAVDTAIKDGKTLDSLVSGDKAMISLPNNVKNWVGKSLPAQVKDTFEEIAQKTPHGDLPH